MNLFLFCSALILTRALCAGNVGMHSGMQKWISADTVPVELYFSLAALKKRNDETD